AAREARYYWPGGRPHRVAFRVVARTAEIPLLPQRASRYKYKYNHGSMEMVSAFSPTIPGRGHMESKSRRRFLQTVGTGVPTLTVLLNEPHAGPGLPAGPGATASAKFTPIDLSAFFNCSAKDFGPRERAKRLGGDSARDGLVRVPGGKQSLLGVPFWLGPEGVERKSWLALSARTSSMTARSQSIPVGKKGGFVCLASFCDWDPGE